MQTDGLCYASCPIRMYPNTITLQCTACPFDCYTCDSLGRCLFCSSITDFRTLSSNRCVPLTGYYENNVTTAVLCPSGCLTCTSASFCTFCQGFYYFAPGDSLCHSSCPAHFYPDDTSHSCTACPYDCYTCLRSGSCLTCNAAAEFRQLSSATLRCVPLSGYF